MVERVKDSFERAQGFMEGTFRRYYNRFDAVEPPDRYLKAVRLFLSPRLLPRKPLAPYPHELYFEGRDWTRSSGPYDYTTKRNWWDKKGDEALEWWRMLETGDWPQVVAGVCWKDELLPPDKIDRTRNFAPLPAQVHYCEFRLFGPIADDEVRSQGRSPVRVGTVMFYGDMHCMLLKHCGRRCIQMDWSSFEYTYRPWLWEQLVRLRASASTQPEMVERAYRAIQNALLHHPSGRLYPASWANKSGRFMTLNDNCVGALLLIALAYVEACVALQRPVRFWEEVGDYLDIFGDNIILSLSYDVYEELGGPMSLVKAAWNFGFILKVEKEQLSPYGLVWNGFRIDAPDGLMVYANPEKAVARVLEYGVDAAIVASQVRSLHAACYADRWAREVFELIAQHLSVAYSVDCTLLSEYEIHALLGPDVPQHGAESPGPGRRGKRELLATFEEGFGTFSLTH